MFKVKYLLKNVTKTASFYSSNEVTKFISLIKNNKEVTDIQVVGI